MFKKYAAVICALLMVIGLVLPARADDVAFSDDFSDGTFDRWTNPAIDGIAGIKDSATEGVATIQDGVMEIDNAATNGSFFYIGMKGIKMLDFTLTMKVRVDQFNDGWLGLSFRKDFNDRYNACNNNMITLRAQTDHKLSLQGYRGYSGSAILLSNKVTGGYVMEEGTEWVTWKIEVQGENWKSYINDELMGQWYYTKNQNEGYLSINACLFDGAVDDVEISGDVTVIVPPTEPTQPGNDPTEPVTAPGNDPTEPSVTPGPSDEPDTSYIKSIYKDVTIDYLFSAISLDQPLNVADFYTSFKLSDGYRLVLEKAGAEVTDTEAMVTDDMKAVVYRGDNKLKEYTLVVSEAKPTEPPQSTIIQGGNTVPETIIQGGNTVPETVPMGVVAAIVAGAILIIGVLVVLLILKKKPN